MISLPPGTRVWLKAGRTDIRCGFDGLAAQVEQTLTENPLSGHVFVFRGRMGDRVKVLWWDGQGMCLFYKRIEKASFTWPPAKDGKISISVSQLANLLEGMDWRLMRAPAEIAQPARIG